MRKTIVISGAIANRHGNGGGAWVRLSWIRGLDKLGYRVYFLEQIRRAACVDESGAASTLAGSVNCAYFRHVVSEFGLSGCAALIEEDGKETEGLPYGQILELAESADLLVNISGHLSLDPLLRRFRRKAYVDLDPGFTQFWHADGSVGARLAGYDFYFSVGENLGTTACDIPLCGIQWRTIRQPVVLDDWPMSMAHGPDRFTTIASWRGAFGPLEYKGKTFGLKAHEFRKFLELPIRTEQSFEIALQIHEGDGKDLELLRRSGWHIVDPLIAVPDPAAFRQYLQRSFAEFSAAQGMYVETNSGWFSDRTVRYLASGKPALVQDTGFSRHYPVGEGLVAFRTLEEAAAGAKRIARDYAGHCRAARTLAEEYFDSDRILGRFMEEVGVPP
jgi:hypothetical protein